MSKATEQRTVVEVEGKITRVNYQGGKIEIFHIPEYPQSREETDQEDEFMEHDSETEESHEGTDGEDEFLKYDFETEESREGTNREEIKGTQEYIEKYFPIVKASALHLEEEFMDHNPTTEKQTEFKEALISAIKSGLSDFRAQRMDACFDEEGNICFKAGRNPAVGKAVNDWDKIAKEFMPEKGSRLGTTKERIAFLGLLIKYLIEEEGYKVSTAWGEVCDWSDGLGHYEDSEDSRDGFEPTGSRQVGEWCDLANTYKITVDDETGGFSSCGGVYDKCGDDSPLARVDSIRFLEHPYHVLYSVGWVVLPV